MVSEPPFEQTELLDALHHGSGAVQRAAELLRRGDLVAFPTETVYGLGARAFDATQIEEIYRVKGRPQDNPLIAHVARREDVAVVATDIPDSAQRLMDEFFPGPLTLVLRRRSEVPDIVSAGLPTIAVRMPDHDVARELIATVGQPLVAPSANRSGRPSPTRARHVLDDLDGLIAAVLDGGPCREGLESTVLSLLHPKPVLLRPGTISRDVLQEVLCVDIVMPSRTDAQSPESPGMKYRHYAPSIPVRIMVEGDAVIKANTTSYVLCGPDLRMPIASSPLDAPDYYHHLREAERLGYEEVLIVLSAAIEQNEALMERIRKSSQG